jgi:hypothetical protein
MAMTFFIWLFSQANITPLGWLDDRTFELYVATLGKITTGKPKNFAHIYHVIWDF